MIKIERIKKHKHTMDDIYLCIWRIKMIKDIKSAEIGFDACKILVESTLCSSKDLNEFKLKFQERASGKTN